MLLSPGGVGKALCFGSHARGLERGLGSHTDRDLNSGSAERSWACALQSWFSYLYNGDHARPDLKG